MAFCMTPTSPQYDEFDIQQQRPIVGKTCRFATKGKGDAH